MKVPVKWLKDYVSYDISSKQLADELTLSGSNVDEVITSGEEIQNVVTGKILKIEPHPDADKLVVCQVDIGSEVIQIVTAATNMKEEDVVPVALHGSVLHGGLKIKRGKLRGILSNGMFCSEEELGIAGDKAVHGLMILPKDTPVGRDIKTIVNMDDAVIDFEITSNRPDCLSIVGMARETAATLNTKYNMPATEFIVDSSEDIKDNLEVEVKDPLCKRYMARYIKDVKIDKSPSWMQERLMQAGVRSINNIVDITNFVMIELGEPMHAFDARQITSKKIVVERAFDGEKFITLDGTERTLSNNVLCIKNGDTTVGIAGLMGGLNSEVEDDTNAIIFECATFDGINIMQSSKKLGLRTEASGRFEKGIDTELAEIAMNRACNLVEQLNAGRVLKGTIDIYGEKPLVKTLKVSADWVNSFLGTDISRDDMKNYLDRLELFTNVEGDTLNINVPTFRGDINIREDVAEEIARIHGFNKIPITIAKSVGQKEPKNKKQLLDDKLMEALLCSGLNQSISYSFVSPKVFDKIRMNNDDALRKTVVIKNPLGEDFSIMRTTTIPSMMESLSRNYSRNNEIVRLFEIGRIYIPSGDINKLPTEYGTATIGMYGKVDYLDLKGVVENILEVLCIKDASFKREVENTAFHPGKTAALYIKKDKIGVLGEIHPDVAGNYGVETSCYICEINLDLLYKYAVTDKIYKQLPKYPAVTRDMALIVDDEILSTDIEDVMKKQGGNLVESIKLFDIYKGKQIASGKKSIAFSITYRRDDKTLVDEEVNKVHDRILRTLENKFGAELR